MEFLKDDAPMLFVFGQSNAHGHGTLLPENEKILQPLTNVFGLDCQHNQSYGLSDVTFSGFVTQGMNLGETQDHTCCLAESFARIWQKRTDKGEELPALFIVQISIGAMGINEYEKDGLNMWWPDRPRSMMLDSLGTEDISLYPLAIEIITLTIAHLKSAGKNPRLIGLHWNQWETEAYTGGESILRAKENYIKLFNGFRTAFGIPCLIWLYLPLSEVYNNPQGVKVLAKLFMEFAASANEYRLLDLTKSPLYQKDRPDQGIFQEDLVHYNSQTHRFFAEIQEKAVFG